MARRPLLARRSLRPRTPALPRARTPGVPRARTPGLPRARTPALRRSRTLALLGVLAPALLALAPAARAALSQTPDVTNTHYTSVLIAEHPVVAGVSWRVIDRNDEVEVVNRSHETVIVYAYSTQQSEIAYDGGQYARVLGNGSVQINENSPAYYLNQSFLAAGVNVPASASATAAPDWVTVARNGIFIWHDHRIHYLGLGTPRIVTDVHERTLLFPWYVPIQVGATRGYLYGKLYWNAEKGFSFPIGAIIALIVVVIGGAAFVIVVRRRRAGAGGAGSREAW